MIRKALFWLALLLASAAGVATPALAETATTCSGIVLYGDGMEHPEGINIRSGPGSQFGILGTARWRNLYDTAFAVSGSKDGWFKVRIIGERDYRTGKMASASGYSGSGWVSASQLFIRYPAGKSFLLRSAPGSSTGKRILVELEESGPQKLLGCQGNWVKISHDEAFPGSDDGDWKSKTYTGWIWGICAPGSACPFRPSWGKGWETNASRTHS